MKHRVKTTALLLAIVGGHAIAQPIKKEPTYPPPYGAFVLNIWGGQKAAEIKASSEAIAKHYGFSSPRAARIECYRTKFHDLCGMDPVAHRRDESPEIQKYGFASWVDAVKACQVQSAKWHDTLSYCTSDPFLRLRAKAR